MNKHLSSVVCATAILLSSVSVNAILAPASAQGDVSLSFDTFHDQLAPYGDWVYSDRWGEVWAPENVPVDFQPYGTAGHWAYTDDYGWTWASDYEWGDIPFHYGRWVNDPDDGWLWIPGYVWSPAWVAWRSNGQYTGWMPMPPDPQFLGGGDGGPSVGVSIGGGGLGVSIDFNNTSDYYGYSQWYGSGYSENSFAANWVFVGTGHMADRDFTAYEAPRNTYTTIIHSTTNITNYTVVNNYVVNKSVDVHVVEKASGHAIQPVRVADITKKPQFITHVDTGREVQKNMRAQMPRGDGHAGSAPKPTPKVAQSLSQKVGPRMARQSTHIYTRDTVAKAPLAAKPVVGVETKPATEPEKTVPGDKDLRGKEPATPPTGAALRTLTPKNPATEPGASPNEGATDKTTTHRMDGEPSVTKPATPPTNTGNEVHAGAAGGGSTTEDHRDHHAKTTVTPSPAATPPSSGGTGHQDDAKGTDKSGAKSVARPEHAQETTVSPKKPSDDQKDKEKPKHDEPDTPQ